MDKPIPEAVQVTLQQDRAGCEWIIVTSKDHPNSESEVTPSDDPALFDLLKALTASQQGQAVAWLDAGHGVIEDATGREIGLTPGWSSEDRQRMLDAFNTAPPPSVPGDLPEFLMWAAEQLEMRDKPSNGFTRATAESLRGRAYLLRLAAAPSAKEVGNA